jgi:hypothetical protein
MGVNARARLPFAMPANPATLSRGQRTMLAALRINE